MNLGTTNKLMPLMPSGAPQHACQHQMHDVFGHIVLTISDVNFGAEHFVSTVRLAARRVSSYQPTNRIRLVARSGSWCQSIRRSPIFLSMWLSAHHWPAVNKRFDRAVGQQRTEARNSSSLQFNISTQAAPIVLGKPWPPQFDSGCCKPCQPPSEYWRYSACLKPGAGASHDHLSSWRDCLSLSQFIGATIIDWLKLARILPKRLARFPNLHLQPSRAMAAI